MSPLRLRGILMRLRTITNLLQKTAAMTQARRRHNLRLRTLIPRQMTSPSSHHSCMVSDPTEIPGNAHRLHCT